jgi:hypothetical protein
MCMQSPCRVETHTCPVGRVVCLLGTICLQTMRIPFALCAWALLLAAPLTHGLTVRAPAKLLATPQSVIWRSDRDRAPRAIPNSPLTSDNSGCVEGPEVSPQTTWALSQDLAEPILMKSISCNVPAGRGPEAHCEGHSVLHCSVRLASCRRRP